MKRRLEILILAAIVTIYLAGIFAYGWLSDDTWPWNELGDTLAGIFAPLAFIFLAAAVYLQNQELKVNRAEAEEQRTVLAAQADEAKRQAEFIGKQTEILTAQFLKAQQDDALDLFEAKLESFYSKIRGRYAAFRSLGDQLGCPLEESKFFKSEGDDRESLCGLYGEIFQRVLDCLLDNRLTGVTLLNPLADFESDLNELISFQDRLSPLGKVHFDRMRLPEVEWMQRRAARVLVQPGYEE